MNPGARNRLRPAAGGGWTLIEAVVALAVVAIVAAAAYGSLLISTRARIRSRTFRAMAEAAEVWRGRVALAEDPAALDGEGTTNVQGVALHWILRSEPTELPGLFRVRLVLEPEDGAAPPRVFETLRSSGR